MAVKIVKPGTARFYTSYSERALSDVAGIIADVRELTAGIKFDTIVGRGTSGALIIPIVARALRKNFVIVRKDEETEASHSCGVPVMGHLGKRWIFLDDFISSGNTFRKVRDAIRTAADQANQRAEYDYQGPDDFETELVGYFEYGMYESGSSSFKLWDENLDLTRGYFDDTPLAIKKRAARVANQAAIEAEFPKPSVQGSTVVGTLDTPVMVQPPKDRNGNLIIRNEDGVRVRRDGSPWDDRCEFGWTDCICSEPVVVQERAVDPGVPIQSPYPKVSVDQLLKELNGPIQPPLALSATERMQGLDKMRQINVKWSVDF